MGDISVGGAVCQLFSTCRREAGVWFFLLLKSGIKLRQHHFMGGFLKTKLLFLCLTQHRKFHFSMNANFYVKRNNDYFFFNGNPTAVIWRSPSSLQSKSNPSLFSSLMHHSEAQLCVRHRLQIARRQPNHKPIDLITFCAYPFSSEYKMFSTCRQQDLGRLGHFLVWSERSCRHYCHVNE